MLRRAPLSAFSQLVSKEPDENRGRTAGPKGPTLRTPREGWATPKTSAERSPPGKLGILVSNGIQYGLT